MARRHALTIGINDYPGTGSDLHGCVNDACDWRDELEARGYDVAQLLDSDATKDNMTAAIAETIAATAPGGIAVITTSSHGTWIPDREGDEPDGRTEALCPYDVASGQLLTDNELHGLFKARPAGSQVVLISDSCHSGSVARHATFGGEGVGQIRFLPPSVMLDEETTARAERIAPDRFGWTWPIRHRQHQALLMSGCLDHQYSYDARFDGRPNGAFTHFALRALRELPAGGSYLDWYRAVRRYLPSRAYPQDPQLDGTLEMRVRPALG